MSIQTIEKRLSNYNFDTKQSYTSSLNNSILNRKILDGSFSIPVWGTENQFSLSGLKVKSNEEPTKIRFMCSNGFRYYSVYNLEQTFSVIKPIMCYKPNVK